MRELKFRAWNKNFHLMGSVLTLDIEEKLVTVNCINDIFGSWPFESCEIMQSTCLTDKTGKEIYEGDIVLTTPGTFNTLKKYVVTFGCPVWSPINILHTETQIIGNIHEHPHLLEKL